MLRREYKYVGPPEILTASRSSPSGSLIETVNALANWLDLNTGESNADGSITATYVVDTRVRCKDKPDIEYFKREIFSQKRFFTFHGTQPKQ